MKMGGGGVIDIGEGTLSIYRRGGGGVDSEGRRGSTGRGEV